MSKLMSLDKQFEKLATRWYIKEYYGDQLKNTSKEFRTEYLKKIRASLNKEDVIKQYFKANPGMRTQYKARKQRINRIKTMAGLGMLVVAVGAAKYTISNNSENNEIGNNQTEYTLYQEPEEENDKFDEFFDETQNMKNTTKRDEEIVKFTKEKIVKAYNKQNKDNPITVDRLQYLHLDENVIAHIDQFGNDVSYERISQRKQYEPKENEVLKKLSGGIYEFKVDEKVVAVYDSNGQEIIDNSIENKNEFFKETIDLLNMTDKLQQIYKYRNNEYDITKVENNYKIVAEKLVETKQIEQTSNEITK